MKKYNTRYNAQEMAESIHREAMKLNYTIGYYETLAEHYATCPDAYRKASWTRVDRYNAEVEKTKGIYEVVENLAFEAGTPIRHREEELVQLIGSVAAKKILDEEQKAIDYLQEKSLQAGRD